ncbi:MAG: reductive dehalogenase [Nitrososphaerales archaeon]
MKPTYSPYVMREPQRFDQRYTVFSRARWEEGLMKLKEMQTKISTVKMERGVKGFTQWEQALRDASWYVEHCFGRSASGLANRGLYSWCSQDPANNRYRSRRVEVSPEEASFRVKRAARLFGADLVGICKLNRSWLYSKIYDWEKDEHLDVDTLISEDYQYAVALAVEMDYEALRTAHSIAGAATGLGYSRMAFVSSMVAEFIRCLGYKAIPLGNDVALSIPIAVDAGLGELGRNGLLITPEYGPRVRLCKVLTDLPFEPDEPIDFGVQAFCEVCRKCADKCPSNAISKGARSEWVDKLSSGRGVLKWPIDPIKCYKFWCANGLDCAVCVSVCPFNKPNTAIHKAARWLVKHAPSLDRVMIWLDNALGYGKQLDAEIFWKKVRARF